jgi:PLP dependent protein
MSGDVTAELVAERLAEVRRRMSSAGGDPAQIEVVAVTKGFPVSAVMAALDAGLRSVGENYAQELLAKATAVGAVTMRWQYLGAVQRRKVPALAPVVACWQSVCRVEEGQSIARRAPGAAVLVEVDLSGLPGRGGVRLDEAPALVRQLGELDLAVGGLMAVGPPGPPESAREGFRAVARLCRELGLAQLSIGMSDDLEVAVSEGSTMVRVGRALFGPRPPSAPPGAP